MVFRIVRGALVGIVLGLLIGVALSGAMYMVNYMREGIYGDESLGIMADAEEEKEGLAVETADGEYIPTLSTGNGMELSNTLKDKGITGLAEEVASGNWNLKKVQVGVSETDTEEDVLGDSLIRFHIRANSNSDVDIALKYKVRDAVIFSLEEGLAGCTTKLEAQNYLADNLQFIKATAEETLSIEGYKYAVDTYLTNDYFPMRQYGEIVLPAGYYQALRIDIGLAKGENFWCLLYPTMCFPMDAGGVVTKEGQDELEKALTEEQYEKLFVKKEVPKKDIEIRFKLFDLIFGED